MQNYPSLSLSPINKLEVYSAPQTEKNFRNKIRKIKQLNITESLMNKYDNSDFNNSLSRTKDISFHSISRNSNVNTMGYLFKSILNQKQNNIFVNTYHNEKFTNNLNNNLSKLINDKTPKVLFDFLSKSNSLNANKTYNTEKNKSLSNLERIPSNIELSEEKNLEKNPIKLQKNRIKIRF